MTRLLNNSLLKNNYLEKSKNTIICDRMSVHMIHGHIHKKTGHLCRLATKLYIIRLQVLGLTCALCMVASSEFQKTDLLFQNWINNICWINPYLMDTCTLKIRKSKANCVIR